jgi:hypothetical protein
LRTTCVTTLGAGEHGRVRNAEPPKVHPQQSRLEHVPADLNNRSAMRLPSWEGPMVDIRVTVEDVTRVPALVGRLARIFERSAISFDRSRNEVFVESEWESRAVRGVLDVVQTWLAEDGAESATLSIGDSSYSLRTRAELAVSP